MSVTTRLLMGRILLVAGITVGGLSWRETIDHVGSADFLVERSSLGSTHAWYHAFREACGDVAKIAVMLLIFFGSTRWRTPCTWWVGLILALGYYAPFWIGAPFLPALSAPNHVAEAIHVTMAALAFAALFLTRPAFSADEEPRS